MQFGPFLRLGKDKRVERLWRREGLKVPMKQLKKGRLWMNPLGTLLRNALPGRGRIYNTLRHGMTYKDPGASHYEERYRNRVLGNLKRRAKSFGYDLQELPPEADMAVS